MWWCLNVTHSFLRSPIILFFSKYSSMSIDHNFINPVIQSASFDMAISMTRLLTLLLHVCITSALVRTLEVSPRVEANHDTFLYLCSLDINEQNVGVLAYRNYQRHYKDKTWLRGTLPFTKSLDGELGSEDGREQPTFWTSTKGCTYRSDFNAGDEEGKWFDHPHPHSVAWLMPLLPSIPTFCFWLLL